MTGGAGRRQGPEQDEELAGQEQQFGGPRGSAGQWASCVRIVDPATAGVLLCFLKASRTGHPAVKRSSPSICDLKAELYNIDWQLQP